MIGDILKSKKKKKTEMITLLPVRFNFWVTLSLSISLRDSLSVASFLIPFESGKLKLGFLLQHLSMSSYELQLENLDETDLLKFKK